MPPDDPHGVRAVTGMGSGHPPGRPGAASLRTGGLPLALVPSHEPTDLANLPAIGPHELVWPHGGPRGPPGFHRGGEPRRLAPEGGQIHLPHQLAEAPCRPLQTPRLIVAIARPTWEGGLGPAIGGIIAEPSGFPAVAAGHFTQLVRRDFRDRPNRQAGGARQCPAKTARASTARALPAMATTAAQSEYTGKSPTANAPSPSAAPRRANAMSRPAAMFSPAAEDCGSSGPPGP